MAEFSILEFTLAIASAAGLLVWSVRLVRTGFERAYGTQMRGWLRKSTGIRIHAAATGGAAAFLLQSATGVAMLVAGFMSSSSIATLPAFAMLLGADVGSALVAQVLVVKSNILMSVLLLVGCLLFLRATGSRSRHCGQIVIGLALILVSLGMILATSKALVELDVALAVFGYFAQNLALAFMVSAVLAWLMHSSLAAILLWVTLAAQGILPTEAAMSMVLGANLGGAFIAFALTLGAEIEVRRVVLANLIWRGGCAALCVIPLQYLSGSSLDWLGTTGAQQALNLHLVFNVFVLCIGLPFSSVLLALASAILRKPAPTTSQRQVAGLLDPSAQTTPSRALDLAARELMHIGERVEVMLSDAMRLYRTYDEGAAKSVRNDHKLVRASVRNLKFYLARLDQSEIGDDAIQKGHDLVEAAIHLASGADVISEKLVRLSHQIHTENLTFSKVGHIEIEDMYDQVLQNVQLGINVLMTQSPDAARSLIERKTQFRETEKRLRRCHLEQLQNQASETLETSDVHLDTLQVLKAVNTSFAMTAYPLLQQTGAFLESRLVA
ncbi:MAG: Na/Pi cotransporter family protein [Paracoccaceae bacterium]